MDFLSTGSLCRWPWWSDSTEQSQGPELHLGLPHSWQGPKCCCFSVAFLRPINWIRSWISMTWARCTPKWVAGIARSSLFWYSMKPAPPYYFLSLWIWLSTVCKWNNIAFVLLWLGHFLQHDIVRVCPCCGMCQSIILFVAE